MLEEIREKSGHWVIKVIFGIIVLVFVFTFWGTGSNKMGRSDAAYAATVNGREIPIANFERDYRQKQDQRRAQTKGMLPADLDDKYLTQQVMDDLIEEELLLQYADDAGIYVSPEELSATIKDMPYFKDEKTQAFIGREKYIAFLKDRGMEPGEFETDVRRGQRLKKTRDFIESAIKVSPEEVRDEFKLRGEKVNLSYVRIDAVALAASMKNQQISQPDIDTWTKANPGKVESIYSELKESRWTSSATAEMQQITIRKPVASASKKPTDDDVNAAKRRAMRALEGAKTDFKKAAEQFAEGAPWEKSGVARMFGSRELPVAVSEKAFTMKQEDAPEMIETPTAYEIIKVKSTSPAKVTELDQALTKEIASEEIRTARATAEVDKVAKEAFESAKKGEALDKIAKAKGLQVKETGAFPHREEIPGIPDAGPSLVTAAFQLAKPGDVLESSGAAPKVGNAYIVAVLKEHSVANDTEFDKQKGWIELSLKRSRSQAAFNAWKADRVTKAKIVQNPLLLKS